MDLVWEQCWQHAYGLVVAKECLPQVEEFSVSHALQASRCTGSQEGAWPGQVTRSGQRDIP